MLLQGFNELPTQCPSCTGPLAITRLTCPACGTEVGGAFSLGRLASLREPHASLLELFLRLRGNMKQMERTLGLSYPTVRARLEEALTAAGLDREEEIVPLTRPDPDLSERRAAILNGLEQGEIAPAEAAARLRELNAATR
ncbi:MAG: DUF2089 domain-containing protein [Chloroflexota bacterium]